MNIERIEKSIRNVPNFPKPVIVSSKITIPPSFCHFVNNSNTSGLCSYTPPAPTTGSIITKESVIAQAIFNVSGELNLYTSKGFFIFQNLLKVRNFKKNCS